MKKLILILMGIFLISFISPALEVKFIEPLDPLVNFTVTPVDGGSQTAGTYDFVAVVTDEKGSFRYGATPESTVLYANNVVLDGTQGINITVEWNATSHPAGYQVYFWYKLDSHYWGQSVKLVLGNGSYSYTRIINPETTVYYSYFGGSPYYITINITGPSPYNFPKNKGAGVIEINGSMGTTDLRTVFNLMDTAGLANTDIARWNNYNQFEGLWGLRIVNGATGTLTINGMTLWFLGFDLGRSVTDGRNYNVQMISNRYGATQISVPFYGGSGSFIYLYNTYAEGATIQGGMYGYTGGSGFGATQMNMYNTILKNCRVHMDYPRIDANSMNSYPDTIIYAAHLMLLQNSLDYVPPLTLYGVVRFYYQQNNERMEGAKVYNPNGAYDIDARSYGTPKNSKFKDSTFYYYDSSSSTHEILYSQDYPFNIYWRNLATYTNRTIDIEHTLNLIVQDENGNLIENANISVYDKNGNLTNTELVGIDGNVSLIIITRELNSVGTVDGTGHTDVVNNFPFTIEISKDNYETYTVTDFNITDKIDWTIALESRDWNYSKSLAWKILNSTGTTVLKLSNLGNLAIAGELYENTNTAPNNVLYKVKDLFWLTKTGDLYLVKELMEVIL